MGAIRSTELIRCQKEEFPNPLSPSLSSFSGCLQRRAQIISSGRGMHTQPLVLITTSSFATEWAAERGGGHMEYIKNSMANTISEVLCTLVVIPWGQMKAKDHNYVLHIYISTLYWYQSIILNMRLVEVQLPNMAITLRLLYLFCMLSVRIPAPTAYILLTECLVI